MASEGAAAAAVRYTGCGTGAETMVIELTDLDGSPLLVAAALPPDAPGTTISAGGLRQDVTESVAAVAARLGG